MYKAVKSPLKHESELRYTTTGFSRLSLGNDSARPDVFNNDKRSTDRKKRNRIQPTGGERRLCDHTNVPDTNLSLACLVCLCFNIPLGAVATYLSLSAARHYRDGDHKQGERKAKCSVFISLFSIVTTVLLVMAYVLWVVVETQSKLKKQQASRS
ncbi:hypothetical protein DPMN_194010 [Dreissena polymorpha]|uniref:Uncharacterized protein n=1 Tax=Dreissena polymorpha TaxID=45954 RepID=A0A9D3Y1J6_DREPO|nr:hypothetical protein DPMN_194010 [Dreissena polymorpha]